MKAVGIICEYNPLHNGHLYHLQKIKENFPDYTIILIVSSCFMQRGETSIINKWDKTKLALSFGIDIVIELPFVFAVQSADIFGKGAIYLLNEMKVSYVIFGSESNDIEKIKKISLIQNTEEYQKKVKIYLDKGINYPSAMNKALIEFTNEKVEKPNDILALSYIKAIRDLNSKIIPISIQRTNNYHILNKKSNITSASSIRLLLRENKKISKFIPKETLKYIDTRFFIQNYFPFLKYKILSELNSLDKYQTVDEGISYRIKKYITSSTSLDELIQMVKTKRYTYNKLSRMFTHILCNFTKEEAESFKRPEYIRILGFSKKGQTYLKQIKNLTSIPIITKYGDTKSKMLEIEKRITSIYASILNESEKKEFIENEYKNHVIKNINVKET